MPKAKTNMDTMKKLGWQELPGGKMKKKSGAGAPVTTHLCERDEHGRLWFSTKMSTLERRFLDIWAHFNGPDLERETAFDLESGGARAWRADFIHRPTRTLIEVEGGAWSGGRHTRGKGFIEDATKYLRAWELGWNVLRLSEKQISMADVERIVRRLRGGDAEVKPAPSWLQSSAPPGRLDGVVSMGTAEVHPDALDEL